MVDSTRGDRGLGLGAAVRRGARARGTDFASLRRFVGVELNVRPLIVAAKGVAIGAGIGNIQEIVDVGQLVVNKVLLAIVQQFSHSYDQPKH